MRSRWRFTAVAAVWMTVLTGAHSLPAAQMTSGPWAPTANMAEARSGASAALLQDRSVLIAGGAKHGEPHASAEIFNRGSVSARGSLLVSRPGASDLSLQARAV